MTEADADAVRHLDQRAFGDWMLRRGYGESMPLRTRENILSLRRRDPQGCFVAQQGQRSVGYVFSHTWGRVGWFGTLGVDPAWQGHGFGRALVQAAVDYLDRQGCTTIGLGTMPEEAYNVGLYARCGFRPELMTVVLSWPVTPASSPPAYTRLSRLPPLLQQALLDETIPHISDEVRPGLNYAPPVRTALQDDYGETLLLGDPLDPWGLVVVRTRSKWQDRPLNTLNVEAGALAAGEERRLGELLAILADFAAERDLLRIIVPINSWHWPVLQRMLALGGRITTTRLRMTLRQQAARPTAADLSTWAA